MPTTRYVNENLTFMPSYQLILQPEFLPENIIYTTCPPGGVSSHAESSSESEVSAPETTHTFHETSNSPLRSPDTTTAEDATAAFGPFLQLVEPPIESIRFRYPTEMKGTHGSILGVSCLKKENARKKIFPSVKLCNYRPFTPDEEVIIRCTITTAEEDESLRIPHVHNLKAKGKTSQNQLQTVDIDDPVDIMVSSPNFQATFGNMTILYTKKEDHLKELVAKKKRHIKSLFINPHQSKETIRANTNEEQLFEEARREIARVKGNILNTACLRFEALKRVRGQLLYERVCQPIFTNPIKNLKSPQFNDLRICRIDKVAGTCLGKDEVFIFVEKVNRKDIKVRFFELNESEEEIWHAYAEMGEDDVHFQFAIAFRTPRYRDIEITDNVKVYFQLERPSNTSRSAPKEFEYTPDPNRWKDLVRKRPRRESPPIPLTVQDLSRPSTSTSTTSLWNSVHPGCTENDLPPGWSRSSSSSAMPESSGTSSIRNSESSHDEDCWDILKDFDFMPLNIEDIGGMEVDPDPMDSLPLSVHSSMQDVLSSFSSGDSENLQRMISSGAIHEWARCNKAPNEFIAQVQSEMAPKYRSSDDIVTDGTAKHGVAPSAVVPQMEYLHHAQQQGPEIEQPPVVQKGLGSQLYNRNRNKLTRDNIVLNVDKVLKALIKLNKNGKIQDKDMKRFLLGIFATCVPDSDDDRVLHVLAAEESFPSEIRRFVTVLKMYDISDIVVNLKNNRGQTALHIAAEKGNLQTISLLVEMGADVNSRDVNLNTALHLMVNRKQNDVFSAASCILGSNPDLSIYNEDGLTVLHLFVMNRKSDVISSFLIKQERRNKQEAKKLINQPDRKQGNTALHIAVQKKFKEIVTLLVNFEDLIDVNAKNFEDKTPLAYICEETGDFALEIIELLVATKADTSLVGGRKNKISKEPKEEDENDMSNVEGVNKDEDFDESESSYAHEWKSEAELKLMDKNTIGSVCTVLDENRNWLKLSKKLDFDEDVLRLLKFKWSPGLYLLKAVAETAPNVTSEGLRDLLIKINPECKKAAQYIDDMILCNMGVF